MFSKAANLYDLVPEIKDSLIILAIVTSITVLSVLRSDSQNLN